jgi:hypothetical protein
MPCCCGGRPSRKVMDYAGSLSWSAILGETDQGTVLSFVREYAQLNGVQLQKAAEGNSRAAANTRNDLRVLCGSPPVKNARLAQIRNSLPKADVVAFDSLGIDSTMLGHEYVLMLQRFPEHFDDAQFLCEQLFRKVSVEDLVESAGEKQRRRSSGESRNQKRAASHKTVSSTVSESVNRDNSRGGPGVWLDGSDFAEQQSRRRSSGSSRGSRADGASRRRHSTSSARNRHHSSAGSQHRTPSATNGLESAVQAEPLTPRRGSEQSIEDFEREMDSFLEQTRQNCSGKLNVAPGPGAVHPSQHGGPPTPKPEKVPYVGAASKGGSFLPPLPNFDSSDQRRRSSGSSSSQSKCGGSTRHERPMSSSSTDRNRHRSGRRRSSGSRSGGASSGSDCDEEDANGVRRRRSDSGIPHRRHSGSSASNRSGSEGQRRRSGSSAGSSAG